MFPSHVRTNEYPLYNMCVCVCVCIFTINFYEVVCIARAIVICIVMKNPFTNCDIARQKKTVRTHTHNSLKTHRNCHELFFFPFYFNFNYFFNDHGHDWSCLLLHTQSGGVIQSYETYCNSAFIPKRVKLMWVLKSNVFVCVFIVLWTSISLSLNHCVCANIDWSTGFLILVFVCVFFFVHSHM